MTALPRPELALRAHRLAPRGLRRYELVKFKLGDAAMRTAEYKRVHPMGARAEDGDATLYESGAIVEYVLARYGGGRMVPATASPEFPRYWAAALRRGQC